MSTTTHNKKDFGERHNIPLKRRDRCSGHTKRERSFKIEVINNNIRHKIKIGKTYTHTHAGTQVESESREREREQGW